MSFILNNSELAVSCESQALVPEDDLLLPAACSTLAGFIELWYTWDDAYLAGMYEATGCEQSYPAM
jgi:hypothetical protein